VYAPQRTTTQEGRPGRAGVRTRRSSRVTTRSPPAGRPPSRGRDRHRLGGRCRWPAGLIAHLRAGRTAS
jgi:hypothetical protein